MTVAAVGAQVTFNTQGPVGGHGGDDIDKDFTTTVQVGRWE